MTELVSADRMRRIEQHIMEDIGIPAIVLMERAALAAAKRVEAAAGHYAKGSGMSGPGEETKARVLVLCGAGNNGADGLALCRILAERGMRVLAVTAGAADKRTELNKAQHAMLKKLAAADDMAVTVLPASVWLKSTETKTAAYDVIVDALLGIGVSRPVEGEMAELVAMAGSLAGYKIAMDIPTGIHTDTGCASGVFFSADETVTFGRIKTGLVLGDGKIAAGRICVDTCGMYYSGMEKQIYEDGVPEIFTPEKEDLRLLLGRDPNGNKGNFGKLSMVVGSRKTAGAAILASSSAFRSGTGYLQVCTHADNRSLLLESNPECVLKLYEDDGDAARHLDEMLDFADVFALGCGAGEDMMHLCLGDLFERIGRRAGHRERVPKTMIFDADALNVLAKDNALFECLKQLPVRTILTPHMKEFERLSAMPVGEVVKDRLRIAQKFAKDNGCILVLKDAQTVVASPDGRVCINRWGNDGMAVAGSGDVLCGVIAAMAGQISDAYMAACAGVGLHALSGDRARERLGAHGMLPQDMIRELPGCITEVVSGEKRISERERRT